MPVNDTNNSNLLKQIESLNLLFAEKLPSRLQEIEQSLLQVATAANDTSYLKSLTRQFHTLAGSAGTFGFQELGLKAGEVENILMPMLEGPALDAALVTKIEGIVHDFLAWASENSGPQSQIPEDICAYLETPAANLDERLIYLVDGDTSLAKSIAAQLEYFGYEVIILAQIEMLGLAIARRKPSAIILDMDYPEGRLTGSAELFKITQVSGLHYPAVFISENNSFEARLAAVQAGADDYLTKPVDVVTLTDRLDKLTTHREVHACRVLIVDDDASSSAYYAAVLRDVGMDVKLLNEPHKILGVLSEFRPELVLMDVYMPTCSGIDLAKVMRQDNRYIDIPIVFLSSETNLGKQLDAIQSGADDFLTKPIKPKHLVSSLCSRVERYTSLRSLILRDSLTGLLNHSAIKDNLLRELSRAKREQSPLALAMIDIDLFKDVNDTYGHPVGDQVIRALSRLLQQRLRRTDIIGRYGGEEFAVIFPSTSSSVAASVLNQIREAFSKIMQHAEQGEFKVTFSAGVVDSGNFQDGDSMFNEADSVLYRAKKFGRNRVEFI